VLKDQKPEYFFKNNILKKRPVDQGFLKCRFLTSQVKLQKKFIAKKQLDCALRSDFNPQQQKMHRITVRYMPSKSLLVNSIPQ